MKISCVVVTYNRLALLKKNIESLLNQDTKLKNIVVVDNASTDGTGEYLSELEDKGLITNLRLSKNIGGSGGFYEGIKRALKDDCDWIWIMDDDTIVRKNSLEELLKPLDKIDNIGFVCSKVVWTDESSHYMNIPQIKPISNGIPFNEYEPNLMVDACSFVSVLVNTEAVRKVGLPYKEFFIWGDDTEYTNRITKKGYNGVYASQSIVEHHTGSNYCVDILEDSKNNYWKYSYGIRNNLFLIKKESKARYLYKVLYNMLYFVPKIMASKKESSNELAKVVANATLKSINFNPKVDQI